MDYNELEEISTKILYSAAFIGATYIICAIGDCNLNPIELVAKYPLPFAVSTFSGYDHGRIRNEYPLSFENRRY